MRKAIPVIAVMLACCLASGAGRAHAGEAGGETAKAQSSGSYPSKMEMERRYITLAPILVSVIHHDDVDKVVTLILTLELKQPDQRPEVERKMPLLRDAFLTDLQRVMNLGMYGNRTVDLTFIKKRLVAVSAKVLGAGVVDDVLVANAFERPA